MSKKVSELTAKTVYNDDDLVLISTKNGETYTSEKTTIAELRTALVGVQPKRYKALLSQDGTATPPNVDLIIPDEIGINWTRLSAGLYATDYIFTQNKTFFCLEKFSVTSVITVYLDDNTRDGSFRLFIRNIGDTDGNLNFNPISIEVYE